MDEVNVLDRIPGDIIGKACNALPDPATAQIDSQEAIIEVPGLGRILITFRYATHKHGKTRQAFWVAHKAVALK